MTEDQKKALELFAENTVRNIKHLVAKGFITFDEAVYLLQSELLEISHNPYGYCVDAGIQFK